MRRAAVLRHPVVIWALTLAAVVGAWQLVTETFGLLNPIIFPSPGTIFDAATQALGGTRLWADALTTATAVFWGVLTGLIAGHVLGMVLGLSSTFRAMWEWPLAVLNSVPRFALAPLVIIVFGLGTTSKASLAFVGVSIPVALLVAVGVRGVPEVLQQVSSVYGLRGRSKLTKLYLPASLPQLFAGLQIGVTQAVIAVVVAEMYNPRAGLGRWIALGQANLNPGQIWFASIAVGVAGAMAVFLIRAAGRRVAHWPA